MIFMGICFIGLAYLIAGYANKFEDKIALGLIIICLIGCGVTLIANRIKDIIIRRRFDAALRHFRVRELKEKFQTKREKKFYFACPCGDKSCKENPSDWPYSHIN